MSNSRRGSTAFFVLALSAASISSAAESPTYTVKQLTPETALKAVQAALKHCRDAGYQVTVAVVDRHGLTQALMRDRFAGAHTVETATNKAWSAVSFRTHTSELEKFTQPGKPSSGIRSLPRVVAIGGGMMIEAGGSLFGGIGVSGGPGGDADDACAIAGIKAISDSLEF